MLRFEPATSRLQIRHSTTQPLAHLDFVYTYPCEGKADVESSDNVDDKLANKLPVVPRSVSRVVVSNATRVVDDKHDVTLLRTFCTSVRGFQQQEARRFDREINISGIVIETFNSGPFSIHVWFTRI